MVVREKVGEDLFGDCESCCCPRWLTGGQRPARHCAFFAGSGGGRAEGSGRRNRLLLEVGNISVLNLDHFGLLRKVYYFFMN